MRVSQCPGERVAERSRSPTIYIAIAISALTVTKKHPQQSTHSGCFELLRLSLGV